MTTTMPAEQGFRVKSTDHLGGREASLMLIDVALQLQLAAPPRTWTQGTHQPGSRRCLQVILNAAADLHGRTLPYRIATARRAGATSALRELAVQTGALGSWSAADPATRKQLSRRLVAGGWPLPSPVLRLVRTGEAPFSPREIAHLRQRARTD